MDTDQIKLAVSCGSLTSGSAQSPIDAIGLLESIHLSWDTAIVTKTVTFVVQTDTGNGVQDTLFSAAVASNASGWYHPRHPIHTSAGAAALYAAGGTSVMEKFALYGRLNFSVSGSDASLAGSPYKMTAYMRR